MDRVCKMIRDRGMVAGLSTHMPETPVYADESGLDVETYIQIYNAAGFLMQVEVDWVHRVIHEARKPVMTIKPMAAGRLFAPGGTRLRLEHPARPGHGHRGRHDTR